MPNPAYNFLSCTALALFSLFLLNLHQTRNLNIKIAATEIQTTLWQASFQ
jgi:hypothetical protein